jgi:hypothetical protein
VRATNAVGHRFRERAVIDPRRARDAEKFPEHCWVGVETLPEYDVPDPLEALNLRIAWDQVVERRLDQGKRAHVLRPSGGCDQGSKHSIGVGEDVRTRAEQRDDVGGVDREVLAPIRGRAWRVAATMDPRKRPPRTQRRERSPCGRRACTSVYQQDLGALSLACHEDRAHGASADASRECSATTSTAKRAVSSAATIPVAAASEKSEGSAFRRPRRRQADVLARRSPAHLVM